MTASPHAAAGGETDGAAPVAPVQINLAELTPAPPSGRERLRFSAILALCLVLHGALLLTLEPEPQVSPVEEAIPVEVVFEAPPEEAPQAQETAPEPEPAPEQPEQPAQKVEERPATDFARAADQKPDEGKAPEASEREAAAPDASAQPEPPQEAPKDAPKEPQPAAEPAPRFAGMTPLPDIQFKAAPARRDDLPSGGAEPGYLSTLYGLIIRKMPPTPSPTRSGTGRVTFGVGANGRIFLDTIAIPSGDPALDAAALAAVRRAAPFPPPPSGGPIYIRFDYGTK